MCKCTRKSQKRCQNMSWRVSNVLELPEFLCNLCWVKCPSKDRPRKHRVRVYPFWGYCLTHVFSHSLVTKDSNWKIYLVMLYHPISDMMQSLVATVLDFTRCEVIAFWSRVLGGWSELIRNWDFVVRVSVLTSLVSHFHYYVMNLRVLYSFPPLLLCWFA